jgi:4-hydroxy-3-methylbut-2-enyl diphosphate reductase
MSSRTVVTAEPCGFCSGVRSALALIEKQLKSTPENIYILKGLIHNNGVAARLKKCGCIFVESVEDIPPGAETVFGAHGVSNEVRHKAAKRMLRVTDATCPLVAQLQAVAGAIRPEQELVLFGHPGHPELEGVIGTAGTQKIFVVRNAAEVDNLPELEAPVLLVQTTLSHIEAEQVKKALKKRFPNAETPGSICRASLLRQQAVERLAPGCDLFVVAGSPHSSNANRLREAAERCGVRAVLLDSPAEVTPELLAGVRKIGLSAAASTPESQIAALKKALENN